MNKRSFIIGTTVGLLIGAVATTSAGMWVSAYKNDEVKVNLIGKIQTFTDAKTGETMYPLTYNDRTYLPVRNIAEMLGLNVDYDDASKTILMNNKDTHLESDEFAKFAQDADNVYSAIIDKFADLKVEHAMKGDWRTNEQIYIELATGYGSCEAHAMYAVMNTNSIITGETSMATGGTGCQYIFPTDRDTAGKFKNISLSIIGSDTALASGITAGNRLDIALPKVRECCDGWYVTSDGVVFNATGYVYDGKTYWNTQYYTEGELSAAYDETRVQAIADGINNSNLKNIVIK